MSNLDSILKSRDITLPTKVHLVKAVVFPVVMYGRESWKESWAPKNWCFWIVVLEKILESPLDCKEIQPVHPKENQLWIFIGSWNSSTLATRCEELTLWKRPWCWERLKVGGEGDDRGWDGLMASLSQWTWVWASSGSWCWTAWHAAVHGVARSQTQPKDWTELNWCITESICSIPEINTTLWINYISIKNCKSCNVPPINNIQQWKEMLGLRSITLWLRDSHLNSVSLRFLIHKYFTGLLQGWSEQDFVRVLNYKNYLSCLFRKKKIVITQIPVLFRELHNSYHKINLGNSEIRKVLCELRKMK